MNEQIDVEDTTSTVVKIPIKVHHYLFLNSLQMVYCLELIFYKTRNNFITMHFLLILQYMYIIYGSLYVYH